MKTLQISLLMSAGVLCSACTERTDAVPLTSSSIGPVEQSELTAGEIGSLLGAHGFRLPAIMAETDKIAVLVRIVGIDDQTQPIQLTISNVKEKLTDPYVMIAIMPEMNTKSPETPGTVFSLQLWAGGRLVGVENVVYPERLWKHGFHLGIVEDKPKISTLQFRSQRSSPDEKGRRIVCRIICDSSLATAAANVPFSRSDFVEDADPR